jgi:hypothetical protein
MFENKLIFSRKYFCLTVVLFWIEVYIAVFVNDQFIRPFGGDILVVILIYSFVKTFWKINTNIATLSVFMFACAIEGLQYFNFIDKLGWRQYKLLVIILGATFSWEDIFAYAIGSAIILVSESLILKFSHSKH